MKIAVPCETNEGLAAQRSGHFGHSNYFTIANIEDNEIKSVEVVKNVDHDTYGCGGVIDYAIGLGIDGIVAAGMGRPPFTRFSQAGVKVYFDTTQPTAGGVLDLLLKGEVQPMKLEQACVH